MTTTTGQVEAAVRVRSDRCASNRFVTAKQKRCASCLCAAAVAHFHRPTSTQRSSAALTHNCIHKQCCCCGVCSCVCGCLMNDDKNRQRNKYVASTHGHTPREQQTGCTHMRGSDNNGAAAAAAAGRLVFAQRSPHTGNLLEW